MLFEKEKLGPLNLRNRSIRSAAFEGMCQNGIPSASLIDYHKSVAAGGIGMTTVAYVAVQDNGRTFSHQSYMCKEIIPQLKQLTDAVHSNGALASIQLGHGGNMGDKKIAGKRAIAPSAKLNLYGLNLPKKMTEQDIENCIKAHGEAVKMAKEAGFDAVEINCGHGYLISQFLSPCTNKRKDKWGGSLENRTRFMRLVMKEVLKSAGKDTAVLAKINMEDGFKSGMPKHEALEVAKMLEEDGVHALVLSGGFVSRTSFFMMKGKIPYREIMKKQNSLLIKIGMLLFARFMVKEYPYKEGYFLDDALDFRKALKLPLVYVGGIISGKTAEEILDKGFDFIAIARALVAEPDFINRIKNDPDHVSKCQRCGPGNFCVATMYNSEAECTFE